MSRLTKTSHVEEEILAWRASLEASRTLTTDDIDELESHVRDDLLELEERGLTTREALWVALGRTGDPVALAEEYNKVNPGLPWARRFYWMAMGFVLFTAAKPLLTGVFAFPAAWLLQESGNSNASLILGAVSAVVLSGTVVAIARAATSPSYGRLARLPRRVLGWVDRHPLIALGAASLPFFHQLAVVLATANQQLQTVGLGGVMRMNIALLIALGAFFAMPPAVILIARRAMRRT